MLRHRLGLNGAPLFLRVMLGIIFVWAGLGKLMNEAEVKGDQAAMLANMGLIPPPVKAPVSPAAPAAPSGSSGQTGNSGPGDATGTPPPRETPAAHGGATGTNGHDAHKAPVSVGNAYTGADFPESVKILQVYALAGYLHAWAHPEPDASGKTPMPLWPPALGTGGWPVYAAWAVAVTELGGGACMLIGLFTRFWALGVACVMLGAMWLTQIGPAVQKGDAFLGVLPNWPPFDPQWMTLTFQFSLFMSAIALVLAGPGRASMDRLLMGSPKDKGS